MMKARHRAMTLLKKLRGAKRASRSPAKADEDAASGLPKILKVHPGKAQDCARGS